VWDKDGLARLNADETAALFQKYVDSAASRYNFDAETTEIAQELMEKRLNEYKALLVTWADDIAEYEVGLERRNENAADASRTYDSFKKHDSRIASELMPKRMSWQSSIDKVWKGLESDINQLTDGNGVPGFFPIGKPGRFFLDSEMLDSIIPYMHMVIGIGLIVGLFARWLSLLGAAFLGSIIASQWPFHAEAVSTSYQQVECLALLTLAAAGAGQWFGLDALWNCCCRRTCSTKETVPVATTKKA
jgi:uncharacterized membrane protein YphA (DoxX/SURF4 family)